MTTVGAILVIFTIALIGGGCGGVIAAHILSKGIREDIRAERAGDLGE